MQAKCIKDIVENFSYPLKKLDHQHFPSVESFSLPYVCGKDSRAANENCHGVRMFSD